MIRAAGWFIASMFVAILAHTIVVMVMMQIPQSPRGRAVRQLILLGNYSSNYDLAPANYGAQANFEFDKFLLFGQQAQVTDAIVAPIVAAVAVILLRRRNPISSIAELALPAAAFAGWVWFLGGAEPTHVKVLAGIGFAGPLFLSIPKLRFRKSLVALFAITVSIASALSWPRGWELTTAGGSDPCLIAIGNSHNEVVGACGPPGRAGGQPKRIGGSIFDWTVCSAPCEARGDLLLFYDCKSELSEVITSNADDFQGCVFESPRQEGRRP